MLNNKHFSPDIWNKNPFIRQSHNCYEYALNKISINNAVNCKKSLRNGKSCNYLKHQPGLYGGVPDITNRKYTCKNLEKRMLKDNKKLYKSKKACKPGFYKIALAVRPNRRYHFYRKHDNGTWSHKEGQTPATNRDASGKIIYNLSKSNRKYNDRYYSKICGEYCLPKDKMRYSNHILHKRSKTKKHKKHKKHKK